MFVICNIDINTTYYTLMIYYHNFFKYIKN
nr:MAG TPA: hypothetical protein [Caudoviricetes sp.]DAV75902.1 MAG TPA: hypothetical protein [Caudoviricetes sp.]